MVDVELKLTHEEVAALINLLTGIIETDAYPISRRIRTLRRIRAKLPGIRAEPNAVRPRETPGVLKVNALPSLKQRVDGAIR